MSNVRNTIKANSKGKLSWSFLQILFASLVLIATILYFCPLKYVQVLNHPGIYYSVFKAIDIEYQWILITSLVLNLFYILYSYFSFIKFKKIPKTNLEIIDSVLFILCILFIILNFVFAFVYSHNYPKSY